MSGLVHHVGDLRKYIHMYLAIEFIPTNNSLTSELDYKDKAPVINPQIERVTVPSQLRTTEYEPRFRGSW